MTFPHATSPLVAAVRRGDRPLEDLLGADRPVFEETDDAAEVLVTFVWEGDHREVGLFGIGSSQATFQLTTPLERLEGTDVWVLTMRVPADVHTNYGFVVDPPDAGLDADTVVNEVDDAMSRIAEVAKLVVEDPQNPRRLLIDIGDLAVSTSIVCGPAAPDVDRFRPDLAVPAGTLEEHEITSRRLDGPRRVWMYTPAGTDPDVAHGLVVLVDGQAFRNDPDQRLVGLLDRLHAREEIEPVVAMLVDTGGMLRRNQDLMLNDAYVEFLADELVGWVGQRRRLVDDPLRRVITGASLGGTNALFAGLRAPDVFGTVLALSPAVFVPRDGEPAWLIGAYRDAPQIPKRIRQEIGVEETFQIPDLRQLHEVLVARGADSTLVEYAGGHNPVGWLEAIHDGLLVTFGSDAPRTAPTPTT